MSKRKLFRLFVVCTSMSLTVASCVMPGKISIGPTPYKDCVVNYFQDGPADQARFGHISGLAITSTGSILVGDNYNRRIRSISTDGKVTTFASFEGPWSEPIVDLAVAPDDTVYFLSGDFLRKVDANGEIETVAGSSNPFIGGFWQPWGMAVDNAGNVIVADSRKNRIKKVTPNGDITELAGSGGIDLAPMSPAGGFADGPGASAMFHRPASVATDASGNLYVADAANIRIRKISPELVVTTLAGSGISGHQDGPGSSAQFGNPQDIAATPDGTVYVVDAGNGSVRRITPSGEVSTLPAYREGASKPTSIAVDASGSVYVGYFADQGELRGGEVLKYTQNEVFQLIAGELAACDWQTKLAY
jgi:Uncharacterized conserved protein